MAHEPTPYHPIKNPYTDEQRDFANAVWACARIVDGHTLHKIVVSHLMPEVNGHDAMRAAQYLNGMAAIEANPIRKNQIYAAVETIKEGL